MVATGARDGSVLIWDDRIVSNAKDMGVPRYGPCASIYGAHANRDSKKRKWGNTGKKVAQRTHTSVTALSFMNSHLLASAGQPDGMIKLWDLRKMDGIPKSVVDVPPPNTKAGQRSYSHGIASLAFSSDRTRLLVGCANSRIHMYDCAYPERLLNANPVQTFTGHVNTSFYVRSVWSPDDTHVVTGSCDTNVYIWDVKQPADPWLLAGHTGDVTCVQWCQRDFNYISTGGDDGSVRLWSVDRNKEGPLQPRARSQWSAQARGMTPPSSEERSPDEPAAPTARGPEEEPAPPRTITSMLANWAQPRPEVGASREGEGSAMAVDEGPAAAVAGAAPGPSSEEATEESSAGGSVGRHRMTVAEGEAMDLDETENKVPEARGSAKPTEAEPAPKKLKAKSMFDYFKKK